MYMCIPRIYIPNIAYYKLKNQPKSEAKHVLMDSKKVSTIHLSFPGLVSKRSETAEFPVDVATDICKVQVFLDFIARALGLLLQRCGFVRMKSDFLRDQNLTLTILRSH